MTTPATRGDARADPAPRALPVRRPRPPASAAWGGSLLLAGTLAVLGVTAEDGPISPLGAAWAEARGHTTTSGYRTVTDMPSGVGPDGLPAEGTGVTVKTPGPAAGEVGDAVMVELAVPTGFALPAACTPGAAPSQPFDGGGGWPDLDAIHACGDWRAALVDGALYAWR